MITFFGYFLAQNMVKYIDFLSHLCYNEDIDFWA